MKAMVDVLIRRNVSSFEIMRNQVLEMTSQMKDLESLWGALEAIKTDNDERIQHLQREIRGVLHRFDNVVDTLSLVKDYSRILSWKDINSEQEELITKINYLYRLVDVLGGLRQGESASRTLEQELSASASSAVDQDHHHHHLVGRVDELELLRSHIQPVGPPQVIAISGIEGMGKTTVAGCLFHDLREKRCFDAFAWVHVGRKFRIQDAFAQLCRQLIGINNDTDGDHQAQQLDEEDNDEMVGQRVREIQERKRCLIVLDELWSLDDWEMLRVAFPPSATTGTKLLVTTRVTELAHQVAAPNGCAHKLRPLTEDEGCDLFLERFHRSHGADFEDDKVVKEIGQKLAKFCGGLPLAIVNFQEYLASKHMSEVSKIVNRSLEAYFKESLETSGRRSPLQVMVSIYDYLPHELQRCFLYLGHFPDHCPIEFEKLYLFWLSDGLISIENCDEELPIDVAERYLLCLEGRGVIELHEEEIPAITRFKSCEINPVMRELSLVKNKDHDFFKVLDFGRGREVITDSFSSSPRTETYRISINLDKYEERYGFPLVGNQKKNIRCLLLCVKENKRGLVWPTQLSKLVEFRSLRLLDFNGFDFRVTKLPRGFSKLIFLRYLSFRGCILPKLPSSVGNLMFLYTLDLRVDYCSNIIIPNVLWKMKRLRHLYLPISFKTDDGNKLRLSGLKELETLTDFNAAQVKLEDLLTLSKLRYLSLKIVGNLEEINWIIKRMNMDSDVCLLRVFLEIMNFDCYTEERHSVLRKLLECQSLTSLHIEGHMYRMPPYNILSLNLSKIVLIGSELKEDPMRILEKLPKLRVLILDDDAFVGAEMKCSKSGFGELKHLELLNLQYLNKWAVEQGAMPRLSVLAIRNCGKLVMLPEELQFVRRLQNLNISLLNKEFKDSLRTVKSKMQEYGVQHGTSMKIED